MTIWADRYCTVAEWKSVQDLFEKHFMASAGPREMILVLEDTDNRQLFRLIAGLPDGTPLALYEGFREIQPEQLPKTASLLSGTTIELESCSVFRRTERSSASLPIRVLVPYELPASAKQ
jgi:hypothetical protein